MNIWIKTAIGIAIVMVILSPIIERQRNKRKKDALGSILLKVDTSNISIFYTQILFGLCWMGLVYMNVHQFLKFSSNPYFQDSDSLGMALFYFVIAIAFIRDGIVKKYDVEFREKGIFSDRLVLRWADVNYYFWNKNQIDFKTTTKIVFFKYISYERLRVNSEQKSEINDVLMKYIAQKPHN